MSFDIHHPIVSPFAVKQVTKRNFILKGSAKIWGDFSVKLAKKTYPCHPSPLEKFSKGQRAEEENNGTHPLTVKVKEW